jgi:chromosome partitioning protein
MPITVCILNNKGGVGKTTTAKQLAYHLTKKKKKVLLIDADSQGNTTEAVGTVNRYSHPKTIAHLLLEPETPFSSCVMKTKYDNLYLIANNITTEYALTALDLNSPMRAMGFKMKMQAEEEFVNTFDFIIIDCPPSLSSIFLTNSIVIADAYIICIDSESSDAVQGVDGIIESVARIKKQINQRIHSLGVLLTMVHLSSRTYKTVRAICETFFKPENIFKTRIRRNTDIAQATINKTMVCEWNHRCNGCADYKAFTKEFLERVKLLQMNE